MGKARPKDKGRLRDGRDVTQSYKLPGVGEGLVDPDFDLLGTAEAEAIEHSVGAHHGRAEDYD